MTLMHVCVCVSFYSVMICPRKKIFSLKFLFFKEQWRRIRRKKFVGNESKGMIRDAHFEEMSTWDSMSEICIVSQGNLNFFFKSSRESFYFNDVKNENFSIIKFIRSNGAVLNLHKFQVILSSLFKVLADVSWHLMAL